MSSLILKTTMRLLLPILLLYSVFLFLRGHNHSGGGFVGGLVAGAAFALYALGFSVSQLKALIKVKTHSLLGWGLLIALVAALFPSLDARPFFSSEWITFDFPRFGEIDLGTPLMFELGVYLVVVGATLTIIESLLEE